MVNVTLTPSSRYNPETNGNRDLEQEALKIIRCFVDEKQINWHERLVDAEAAYNSAPHSDTTFSP
jgi:hypothetical protein